MATQLTSLFQNCLDRKCAVIFRNQNAATTLDTPRYFNKHGSAKSAIVPEILTGEMQTMEFAKTPFSMHGLKGVLVYRMKCQHNVDDADVSLAIMWNIPPASKPGKSGMFAVGIIPRQLDADEKLYELMAKGGADWFQRKTTDTYRKEICIGSERICISATLSDGNSAFLSVMIN